MKLLTTAASVIVSVLLALGSIYLLALLTRLAVEAARLGWHAIP